MKGTQWTPKEERRMREAWETHQHSVGEIARMLGRTRASVSGRLAKLDLFGGRAEPRIRWSREDTDFLLAHYRQADWPASRIAERLGRPVCGVYEKARYFGASEPERDYKAKPKAVDQRIITLAMANTSSAEIGRIVGCSAGYVWKVMKARPGLHKRWKAGESERRGEAVARAHQTGLHPGPKKEACHG